MRVIYLTLLVFILFGIGANCRTPTIMSAGNTSTTTPQITAGRDTTDAVAGPPD